jgi:RIO kinase 1
MDDFESLNPFEQYEAEFDPLRHDRQARRKRKPDARHRPKKTAGDIVAQVAAEAGGLESGFATTYQPGPFEEGWLLAALRPFYDTALITDVLGRVKGGKEASVYRCQGHPATGHDLLAAKVYRPRMFRNMSNDAAYREGREMLNQDGHVLKKTDSRAMRAVGKKTAYGQQVAQMSWLMYEYTTLQKLHAAGADVPRPVAAAENALLMSYHGTPTLGAPTLHETVLEPAEAQQLYERVIANIELMLQHGIIHGDLSPYNILYDSGQAILIDFPQVVFYRGNNSARFILNRDITRVCDYFAQQGVPTNAYGLFRHLWQRYAQVDASLLAADLSRREVDEDDDAD